MTRGVFILLTVFLLALSPFTATRLSAQSIAVCGGAPFLGATASGGISPIPEICAQLSETPPPGSTLSGATINLRGPSPMTIATTIGDYDVDLTVTFTPGASGHALTIDGTVTKLGNATFGGSPGGLSLHTIAGYGQSLAALPEDSVVMMLDGSATGTSRTQFGVGFGRPFAGTGDIAFVGHPVVLEEVTNQSGAFSDSLLFGNLSAGIVAVSVILGFHLNDAGASISIPASVIVGNPSFATSAAVASLHFEPHFECYDVEVREDPTNRVVKLVDQFAEAEETLGDIQRICTPVSKNDEEVPNPKLHLVCYEILKGHEVHEAVRTTNQFATQDMTVTRARELCVPSLKKHLEPGKE